jgi:hypothetical protein
MLLCKMPRTFGGWEVAGVQEQKEIKKRLKADFEQSGRKCNFFP